MNHQRIIDESIDIAAPADAVWKAMTDAGELMKWFAWTATSTTGVGGRLDLNWGEGIHWPMLIRVWDPPRHVRFEDRWPRPGLEGVTGPRELFIDFFVEARAGGQTRLRVVHSGFSGDPLWNGLYDSTSCGWRCELAAARYYLEHWLGRSRDPLWISRKINGSLDDACRLLLGPGGLALEPHDAERHDGETVLARWRGDPRERVTILRSKPGRMLVLSPRSEPGALVMAGVEPPHEPTGNPYAMIRFNLYDTAKPLAPRLKAEWESRLAALFVGA